MTELLLPTILLAPAGSDIRAIGFSSLLCIGLDMTINRMVEQTMSFYLYIGSGA